MREYMGRVDSFKPYPFDLPERHNEYVGLHLNDYLRLSARPEVIAAKYEALRISGNGNMASVIYGGACRENNQLRALIADVLKAGDVFLTVSGYTANLGVIESIVDPGMPIYLDERAHASMWDGAKFSSGRPIAFRHNDPGSLAEEMASFGPGLVCIDTYYSVHGDAAPLTEILEIVEDNDSVLLADEAHSFAMVGDRGGGVCIQEGVAERVHFRTASFSKALGGHGGFVAAAKDVVWFLTHRSRSSVFSSAVLPDVSAGHLAALELAIAERDRATHCLAMAALLRDELARRGIDTRPSSSQIVPIAFDLETDACRFFGNMRDRGVLVSIFVAPGVDEGTGVARLSCHADLTPAIVKRVADVASQSMGEIGIRRHAV
jgi:CAI-1 autoinducer synthase